MLATRPGTELAPTARLSCAGPQLAIAPLAANAARSASTDSFRSSARLAAMLGSELLWQEMQPPPCLKKRGPVGWSRATAFSTAARGVRGCATGAGGADGGAIARPPAARSLRT